MHIIRAILSCLLFNFVFISTLCYAQTPEILLAQVYQSGLDVSQYLISEKYDGVRAIWDGKQLTSRQGNVINAPPWFTKNFPQTPLDGELWLARGQFDALSGAVRKDVPIDAEWQHITYQIFELPNAKGTFEARYALMLAIAKKANLPQLKVIKQFKLKDEAALKKQLNQTVKNGGEGLMLHLASAEYVTGRSDVLIKLKPLFDAEATVIAHTAGKGKYAGKLGALVVQTPEGIQFKLGTGFTDAERENPPKIGSLVTYTYKDKTQNGKPKSARFLRVRDEK